MLDVKRLQVLLSVVELGSVTAAADALVYTPSAVSQQLRRLEREVGQPLLRRHARGMSPTDAGLVLAAHARTVLRRLSAAEADLAEIAGLRQGRLALGTFPTVASSFLPLAVHRFSELHPAIRLEIRSERQPQLIEWLENGTVDLSLLWDYQWQRLDSTQLDLTELFSDPTVLLVSSQHRLARRRRDPADQRRALLSLTPAGTRLLRALSLRHQDELRARAGELLGALRGIVRT